MFPPPSSLTIRLLGTVLLAGAGAVEARASLQAEDVFERYAPSIVQVRIIDRASGEKTAIGSGFYVAEEGYLVTNYHVVADVVLHPEQFDAELVDDQGETQAVKVHNLDVVHDLALLRSERAPEEVFEFATQSLAKGTRVFSLGNPYDLGSSIVEGTYNGLLEGSLYEKIHFTGAINAGMSGGPAVVGTGQVIGVNVSTAGDELSFLVPAKYAARLLRESRSPEFDPGGDLIGLLRKQILANQEMVFQRLLSQERFEQVQLGAYRLPGKIAPFFNCWGSSTRRNENPYEIVSHECSTEDEIYLDGEHAAGSIDFQHNLISSDDLNALQFFSLYQATFADDYTLTGGESEQVSRFECASDFVGHADSNFKVAFCLRAYRKLPGVYDAVLKLASLNSNRSGVQSTLVVSGVSFENADRFARRYLESIGWREP